MRTLLCCIALSSLLPALAWSQWFNPFSRDAEQPPVQQTTNAFPQRFIQQNPIPVYQPTARFTETPEQQAILNGAPQLALSGYLERAALGDVRANLGVAYTLALLGRSADAQNILSRTVWPARDWSIAAEQFRQQLTGETPRLGVASATDEFLRIGLLIPQSGALQQVGYDLLKAAEVALFASGNRQVVLQISDSGSTPETARAAAEQLIRLGVEVILGPLTREQTRSVSSIARRADIPLLSFTNDKSLARAGVWPLGIDPKTQVYSLLDTAKAAGMASLSIMVPASESGAQYASLAQAAAIAMDVSLTRVITFPLGEQDIGSSIEQLVQVTEAKAQLEEELALLEEEFTLLGGAMDDERIIRLEELRTGEVEGIIDFDTLLLAAPAQQLALIASQLEFYDVASPHVRILVPTPLPTSDIPRGIWYAQPQLSQANLVEQYMRDFGSSPSTLNLLSLAMTEQLTMLFAQLGSRDLLLNELNGEPQQAAGLLLYSNGNVQHNLAVYQKGFRRDQIQRQLPPALPPMPPILSEIR